MSSIQILPPVELPEPLARLLDEALWDRAEPERVATTRDKSQAAAVDRVEDTAVGGYVVRTAGEVTWFSELDQAEKHFQYLIAGTGLSEDYV